MRLNKYWFILLTCVLLAACSPVARAAVPTADDPAPADPLAATAPPAAPKPAPTLIPATPTPLPTIEIKPTATVDPRACLKQAGRFETGSVNSPLLADPLDYRVYLPACYDQRPNTRYPVLYLIHGQSFTDDQWQRLGAGTAADRLIAAGHAAPFLIVMPRDRIWADPDKDPFGDAVVQTLIPYIDSHYRTEASRLDRAVGGLSRGAGWAAHLGLTHPELFGKVGMHSLALFWADVLYIKTWVNAIPENEEPHFYFDIGNNDRPEIMQSAKWFEDLLDKRDIPHEWHFFVGYHEEKYWQAHVEQYLLWYTQGWKDQ